MKSNEPGRAHASLRRATAAAHHALDRHPLLQRLIAGGLTRDQYAESLAAMYRPHARLERQVHASSHHCDSGLELATRLPMLEADLSDLGWPVPSVSQARPDLSEGRAAWWGRLYVLEGSRQGGVVIARRVRASLGDSVPCRFFGNAMVSAGQSAQLALRERELENDQDLDEAVASARASFADYQAELDAFECRSTS